jgi:hypothetical protein
MNFLRRYRLEKDIGEGGMGIVYRAQDRLTGRTVALKQVNLPKSAFDPSMTTMDIRIALAEEFRTLASLRHPNVISVLDYGFDEALQPYFTMDLLEAAQPITIAARNRPAQEQFGLMIQALQALVYLHRRKLLHRDLKPGNILVTQVEGQPVVKVLDFGLAIAQPVLESDRKRQTAGTISYMSPELLRGEIASKTSDLYAMGIIGYEFLVGAHPFKGRSTTEMLDIIPTRGVDLAPLPADSPYTPLVKRMLAFDPADRFPEAAAVIRELSALSTAPIVYESDPIRESFLQAASFVGREPELHLLTGALGALGGADHPRFWLVGGESGVGKTRLLEEVRTQVLVQGTAVVRGQAKPDSGAWHIWNEVVRWLALEKDLSNLEARVLKTLVPDIMAIRKQLIGDPPPLDAQGTRERLLQTLQTILNRQLQAVLLMLEDLHWADEESLLLLNALANNSTNPKLKVVASFRDDELPDLPQRLPQMELLRLKRLTYEHVTALSTAILGGRGSDKQLIAFLQKETEGNALFLVEVMRVLAENTGTLEQINGAMLPAYVNARGVQNVMRQRLEHLPAPAREALNFAAILGRDIELPILRAFNPTLHWEDWLGLCADYAILDVYDERWRFAHDKLRETVLADIAPESLKALHREAAEAIERAYEGDDPASIAVRLAYHWNKANNPEQERKYSLIAGQRALRNGAAIEAARLLSRTLELRIDDPLTRADLEFQLSDALLTSGNLPGSYEHGRRALQILGYPEPRPMGLAIGRALLRQAAIRFNPIRAAKRSMRQRESIAAHAFDKLAFIDYLSNRRSLGIYNMVMALNLNERRGPSRELSRSYAHMSFALTLLRVPRFAERYVQMAFRAAQDDLTAQCDAALMSAVHWFGRGSFEQANHYFDLTLTTAQQIGNPRAVPDALYAHTVSAYFEGNFAECLQLARACHETDARNGFPLSAHPDTIYEVLIGLIQGQTAELGKFIAPLQQIIAETELGDYAVCLAVLAQLYLIQGDLENGQQMAQQGLEAALKTPPILFSCLTGYILLAEIFLEGWENGDQSQARAARQMLKVLDGFTALYPIAAPSQHRLRGLSLWLEGNEQAALTSWERGLTAAEQIGTRYECALLHFEIARHLPKGALARKQHLAEAKQHFEELGAVTMLTRANSVPA